jgi:hypothetical protein
MLCKVCQRAFQSDQIDLNSYHNTGAHHNSIQDLYSSAREPCQTCALAVFSMRNRKVAAAAYTSFKVERRKLSIVLHDGESVLTIAAFDLVDFESTSLGHHS